MWCSAAIENQIRVLCWLSLGVAFAVWEGGLPWTVFKDEQSALPIICFRAVCVSVTTVGSGVLIGLLGKLLHMQPRSCFSLAFQLSIGFALVGCLVDFAELGHFVSVWLPMVAFAPRIARKISAPETGFW